MARTTPKTTTASTARREPVTDDPRQYASCRAWCIRGEVTRAVSAAHASGYRIEREHLILPELDVLECLTDETERRDFERQKIEALRDQRTALRTIALREEQGWHAITRASEQAARRAAAEQATVDHAAAVERNLATVLSQQEADRLAHARSIAEAMARR